MREYTKYNPETGDILGVMVCDERTASLNGPTISGHWDYKEYVVVDGVAQKKPDSEIETQKIAESWDTLRRIRDGSLKESDWTQVSDAPVDSAAWATYRQQLRDLPANTTDPRDVTWPVPPS
jgi:hypothetical protein